MKFEDRRVQRIYNQVKKTVKARAKERESCTEDDYQYYVSVLHDYGIFKYDKQLRNWLNMPEDN